MKATMTKTQTAQPMGQCRATQIDCAKAAADIRIIAMNGTATIQSKIALQGRGIKAYAAAGCYEVSKAALAKLEKTYCVVCDF